MYILKNTKLIIFYSPPQQDKMEPQLLFSVGKGKNHYDQYKNKRLGSLKDLHFLIACTFHVLYSL